MHSLERAECSEQTGASKGTPGNTTAQNTGGERLKGLRANRGTGEQ